MKTTILVIFILCFSFGCTFNFNEDMVKAINKQDQTIKEQDRMISDLRNSLNKCEKR